jgi:hypothetical protein
VRGYADTSANADAGQVARTDLTVHFSAAEAKDGLDVGHAEQLWLDCDRYFVHTNSIGLRVDLSSMNSIYFRRDIRGYPAVYFVYLNSSSMISIS